MLAVLLAAMPWAALSPATSPPSQWAGLVYIGVNAAGCLAGVLVFSIVHGGWVALCHFRRPLQISEGK